MSNAKALLLTLLIFCQCVHAQRTTWTYIPNDRHGADSLLILLSKETDEKKQVLLYKGLSWNYKDTNMDTALLYANKGIELAKKIGFNTALVDITRFKSIIYWGFLHHNVSYDLNEEALQLAKDIDYTEGEGFGYDRLGVMEYYKGNYPKAISMFTKAKTLFEKINYKDGLGYEYSHLNWAYTALHNYDQALQTGRQSLTIRREQKNKRGIAKSLNDIGLTYVEMGVTDSAIYYLKSSINYAEELHELIYQAEFSQQLAELYLTNNNLDSAYKYANTSYQLSTGYFHSRQVVKSAMVLYKIYKQKGDYQHAFQYLNTYYATKDSLNVEENNRNIVQQELKYEYEKEKVAISQRQMLIRYGLIAIIFLVSIIAILIFRYSRKAQRNNRLLQIKNNEISLQKAEIQKQATHLEDLNQMKSKLFSIVAHDLKNPIALTSVYMHLLHEEALNENEFQRLLPEISKHLKNTTALMNNLLLWANSQMDGIHWSPENFDLFELADSNTEFIQSFAKMKGICIKNQIPPSSMVYADKSMTEIVVRNLLSNAVKFCKTGDSIRLASSLFDHSMQINIIDTGIGIPPEKIVHLFTDNMHSETGTANEKGWGLGLILCREFVERNKGKIWVESIVDKGSNFHFTLPIGKSLDQ